MNAPAVGAVLLASALLSFAAVPATPATQPTAAPITKEELGRILFWDPILSGHKDVSCATCHHPDWAYADGRDLSLGAGAVGLGPTRTDRSGGAIPVVKRNSPTVLNTYYNGVGGRNGGGGNGGGRGRGAGLLGATPATISDAELARAPMFWDRRIRSLDLQALEPLKAQEEMRGTAYPESVAIDSAVARLRAIPEYVTLFGEAFGSGTIEARQVGEAMAAFQRTLVAMNSPFDRYRAGDTSAMTAQQVRGLGAFRDAGCGRCHSGTMFSDFNLHAEGVAENPKLALPDTGASRYRFRTPTLRNVALTAPFMHNGMLATLDDVLEFYDRGRSENPNVADRGQGGGRGGRGGGGNGGGLAPDGRASLDGQFQRVSDMSDGEMKDIVAFLEALSDPDFDRTIPTRVPSGLVPGGALK